MTIFGKSFHCLQGKVVTKLPHPLGACDIESLDPGGRVAWVVVLVGMAFMIMVGPTLTMFKCRYAYVSFLIRFRLFSFISSKLIGQAEPVNQCK